MYCQSTDDPLIGASDDKIGEILNYENEYRDYFVDNLKSNNAKITDKIASEMKNVMKEVVLDHFQLTEEKLCYYFQQTNDKLDAITLKLDLSHLSATNSDKKLDYIIATNSDKKLDKKLDYIIATNSFLIEKIEVLEKGSTNLTLASQNNSERDAIKWLQDISTPKFSIPSFDSVLFNPKSKRNLSTQDFSNRSLSTPDISTLDFSTLNYSNMNFSTVNCSTPKPKGTFQPQTFHSTSTIQIEVTTDSLTSNEAELFSDEYQTTKSNYCESNPGMHSINFQAYTIQIFVY